MFIEGVKSTTFAPMTMITVSNRNYREAWEKLSAFLEKAHRVVLFGHRSPDGDSVGSTLAMRLILEQKGIEASVVMSGSVPSNLLWLPEVEHILLEEEHGDQIDEALRSADLFICLDFNALYRVGKNLEERLRRALSLHTVPVLMIDHHLDPFDEFDWQWSCPEASATAEVLARLYLGTKDAGAITKEVATALLTGIMTDTGLFNHNSSSPELYELVAALLRCGADKDLIIDKVFHNFKEKRQRLEGYILYEKVQVCRDINAAYFTLSLEELEHFEVSTGDTDGMVNKPLDIEGITCSAFFRETVDEGIKISLRSVGNIPVNELSRHCYGGGGHKNASGGEMPGATLDEAVALFLAYMREHHTAQNK
ncbi:DHH family phosphoesterase [Porphyromonas circumdentaria]|uniref:Phosphoesterase RecJ domain-containing protein n=2 Tax=Porphyromonas circumdentaria TaxID=29524 RepID=A0A1T4P7A3_9PORP|nr:bifunctional oligoribonuclease/PAP phosphatase NrnA [Porphyromonas circumdentaria]SJZ87455.1 phosphoesterase RecJ domain-containing protein [Porphyromonas circumdentaria]